jgi:K+-transporting ATPase A subunit
MNFNWKEIKPRNILTIITEIATILSLVLAWIMYRNPQPTTSTTPQTLSPIMYVFIAVIWNNVSIFNILYSKSFGYTPEWKASSAIKEI